MSLMKYIRDSAEIFCVIGNTGEAADIVKSSLTPYLDTVECDRFGNVIGRLNCGNEDAPVLMLETNIVRQSFLVTEISEDGRLFFLDLGHSQWPMPGHVVKIKTRSGEFIFGIVFAPPESKNHSTALSELMIDTGLVAEQVREYINIGDSVVFFEEPFALKDGLLCSSELHAHAGFGAILCALQQMEGQVLPVNLVIAVSTSHDGASDMAWRELPRYAISLNTCSVPAEEEEMQDVRIGKGPVIAVGPNSSPTMAKAMATAAKEQSISYQLVARGRSCGADAWKIRTCGYGAETLSVYLPVKYMYTPTELLNREDIEDTGKLLAKFIAAFRGVDKK